MAAVGIGLAIGRGGWSASGRDLGRTGNRQDEARGRVISIVRSARACGRAQPLLCRTGASGVRARGGVAALGCDSRRLDEPRATATGGTGAAGAGNSRAVSGARTAQVRTTRSARRKLAATAFLRIAECRFRKEPQADSVVSRRHAMVRFRFVRVAQCTVDLFRRRGRPGAWDGAGGGDGPRTSVHPVS